MVTAGDGSESTNRAVWGRPSAVVMYRMMDGWIDVGERTAIHSVADEVRGAPLLEIGMGAGRVTSVLRLLTDRYTAIDWAPEMVAACRDLYPDLDIRQGDARDLSAFGSEQFNFVCFSYNGIDNVDHLGRMTVLDEVFRVLRPGGIFVYCTFNRCGPAYGQPPWRVTNRSGAGRFRRVASFGARFPGRLGRYRRMYRNWWRNRRHAEDHGVWALCPVSGQEFGLLQHFTTPTNERLTLEAAGFAGLSFFDRSGQVILSDPESAGSSWFHIVARKPGTPSADADRVVGQNS